jgi:hypothetical protein
MDIAWTLVRPRKGEYVSLEPDNFTIAYKSLPTSKLGTKYEHLLKILLENDFLGPDPIRPDKYCFINPVLTFALRKIVFASEDSLTTLLLPLAIGLAAEDYHVMRYRNTDYVEDFSSTCQLML